MTKQKFFDRQLPTRRKELNFCEHLSYGDDVLTAIERLRQKSEKLWGDFDKDSVKITFGYGDYDESPSLVIRATETEESFRLSVAAAKIDAEKLWISLQKEKKDRAAENKKRELAEFERLKKKYDGIL